MDNKEVLLQFKNTIKFKKTDGTLKLIADKLVWTPVGSEVPKVECPYSEIKVQRISPEGSSKVQLQVVKHDGSSFSFHFANPEGRDKQLSERNDVKDQLAQLIPAHRHKANKELEAKNKMLTDNPELYQLYKDLVVSGIITSEEFWSNRNMSNEKAQKPKESSSQEIGISSGFLADIRPDMHGCNELRFNLTVDSIEAIFKTYPAVRRKFEKCVPNEMTEKDFWTEFFRSQHFHRDRFSSGKSTKDMFGDCAKKDEQQNLQESIDKISNPLLDLTGASPVQDEGYGQGSFQGSSNIPLVRMFNHQSLMVLKTSSKHSSDDSVDVKAKQGVKKMKLREALEYDDLENNEAAETAVLKILDSDKFAHVADDKGGKIVNGSASQVDVTISEAVHEFESQVQNWNPSLSNVLSSEQACSIMADVAPGGKLMADSSKGNTAAQLVPNSTQSDLQKQYHALSELLRHFWSCFPVKTQQLEEKVNRMANCLHKFQQTKLKHFESQLPKDNGNLTDHLTEMINAALIKYKTWQDKRISSKQ